MAVNFDYDPKWKPQSDSGPNFDYDPNWKPETSSALRQTAGDLLVTGLKSAVSVPEAAVGLLDIPTGGRVGKALESAGVRFKDAQDILSSYYSPEQKRAEQAVQEADGVMGTLSAVADNPRVLAHTVLGSIAPMLAGGAIGRGLGAVSKLSAPIRGAIGEGAVGAGSAAEGIRQETQDGTLSGKQSALALLSGVGTGAFGAAGGKVAQKLGIADVDTLAAGGVATGPGKGVARRVAEGAAAEGLLEELPQSLQETALQNLALDRPIGEGMAQAGVLGALAGGVMGGGAAGIARPRAQETPPPAPELPPDAGPLTRAAAQIQPGSILDTMRLANEKEAERASAINAEETARQQRVATGEVQSTAAQMLAEGAFAEQQNQEARRILEQRLQSEAMPFERIAPEDFDTLNPIKAGQGEIVTDAQRALPAPGQNPALPAAADRPALAFDPTTAKPMQATERGDVGAPEQMDAMKAQQAERKDQMKRAREQAKNAFPFKTEAAAQKQAVKMQATTGEAHEVVPHPSVDGRFAAVRASGPDGSDMAGEKISDEWTAFSEGSGSLGVPRAQMPQVKAEHRGALANFLSARGVEQRAEVVSAETLKPTQAEFSPAKVKKAKGFSGGDRAIIVSQDGHVLDGHHQWLAKRDAGEDIKVIRMDAPIQDLIQLAHEFPSSTTSGGASVATPSPESDNAQTPPAPVQQEQAGTASPELSAPVVAPVAGQAAPAPGDQGAPGNQAGVEAGQRAGVANPAGQSNLKSYTRQQADRYATILTRQGLDSKVVPHPESPGTFAVVPQDYIPTVRPAGGGKVAETPVGGTNGTNGTNGRNGETAATSAENAPESGGNVAQAPVSGGKVAGIHAAVEDVAGSRRESGGKVEDVATAASGEVEALQKEYDAAKSAIEAIGPEPYQPKVRGSNPSPEDARRFDEAQKTHQSWKRKYLRLKKAEVEASNRLFRAKRAAESSKEGETALPAQNSASTDAQGTADQNPIKKPDATPKPAEPKQGAGKIEGGKPSVPPVSISPSAIPLELASGAFRNTSHTPDRRGQSVQAGYVGQLEALRDRFAAAYANAPKDRQEAFVEAFNEIADRYASLTRDYLSSHSRVASAMIVGPAKFPTERNRKRSEAADKKAQAADDFLKKAPNRLARILRGAVDRSLVSQLKEAEEKLAQNEQEQEHMKAANAALRKGDDAALEDLGMTAEQIAKFKKPDFGGRVGYPDYRLRNNNAEIRRMRERVEDLNRRIEAAENAAQAPEDDTPGPKIVQNAAEDRVQILFDGKPPEEVRDALKAAAFRWSPKNGAWQRKLTPQAVREAERIVGEMGGGAVKQSRTKDSFLSDLASMRKATTLTVDKLKSAIAARFPSISGAVDAMLKRGDEGNRGGLVLLDTTNEDQVAKVFAEKTGRTLEEAKNVLRLSDEGGMVQGLFDPQSGILFLLGPNLTEQTAPAVLLHEIVHSQQRQDIDAKALDMIERRGRMPLTKEARAFLNRVATRMESAGVGGDASESTSYIVEQAVLEGRQAGFSAVDGKFLDWVDANLSKRIGDIVRNFAAMVRAWGMRHGVKLQNMAIDDLVAFAKAGARAAARGDVVAAQGKQQSKARSLDEVVKSDEFKDWFADSKMVGKDGKPLTFMHGSPNAFEAFDSAKLGAGSQHATATLGHFFTRDTATAEKYADGGQVYKGWLKMAKPYVMTLDEAQSLEDGAASAKRRQELQAQGHDGTIILDDSGKPWAFVVFEPWQFKSTENRGTFDEFDDRFRFSRDDTIDVDGTPRPRTNSEGRKIHPTDDGVRNFWRWFKGSRVVDEQGRPKVVYHGTADDIEAFNVGPSFRAGHGKQIPGIYFSPLHGTASAYARTAANAKDASTDINDASVVVAYLSIQNPVEFTDPADFAKAKRAALESRGHDGAIRLNQFGQVVEIVAFSPNQIKSATGNAGTFDPADDRIQFSRASTMPDWLSSMPQATQEAARKAGVWAPQVPLLDRLNDIRKTAVKRLQQGLVDQFAPLRELGEKEYILARLTKSSDAPLEALLMYGKPRMNDAGAIDVDQSGGFIDAMQELDGEHDRFFAWMAGNRAEQLKREGRENLFTDDDISALKNLADGDMADGRKRVAIYRQMHRRFNEFGKSVLDISEKAGIIGAEDRAIWESDFYVPFYRALEDGDYKGPRNVSGLVNQYAFKTLKGGTDNLNDLMQNTLRNWSHLLSASLKNQAAAASLKTAETAGAAVPVQQKQKGAVTYLEDGKERHMMVDDPFILNAITSLEWAGWSNPAMRWMQKAKHYLTLGVTISPTFKIRNLIRDQIAAIGQNPVSYNLLRNLSEGWKGTDKNSAEYAKMLAGGGLMRFGTFLEDDRAAHLKRLIDAGVPDSTVLDTPKKVKAALSKAWDWWQDVGDRSENVTRAAIYKQRYSQMLAQGMSEDEAHLMASFAARDSMDFSLQGQWGSIRFLTQLVPFLGARLQGLYKLGREGIAPTARLLTGNEKVGDRERAMRFGAVAGAVALASMALLLAYRDDDEWKKREQWDRDSFFWFRIGDTAFRIPKPFEIGALGTIAERGLETALNGFDGESRRIFAQRLGHMLTDTFAMNPVPQLVKPLIDLYANTDSFTGRPIETMGMERLSKENRVGLGTSATAQLFGKATSLVGLSPVQVDHLIDAYFSWLGTHIVMTADFALRPMMDLPDRPARRWPDNYFMVGDFARGLPAPQSKYVTQFYEQSKKVQQAMADIRYFQRIGETEKALELQQENSKEVRLYGAYTQAQRQLANINRSMRAIQVSDRTPEAKRDELDRLSAVKDRLAQAIETRRAALQ